MDREQAQVTTENRIEESPAYRFAYDFAAKHAGTLSQTEEPANDAGREESRVLSFFRNLSTREKFLIRAYMEMSCAMNEHSSDDELREAVEFDADELGAEYDYIKGALHGANLAS